MGEQLAGARPDPHPEIVKLVEEISGAPDLIAGPAGQWVGTNQAAGTVAGVRDIKKVWRFYVIMATLVGVLLVVLCLIGVPLKYMWWVSEKLNFAPGPFVQGEPLQRLGEHITVYLGITHGYLYMVFLLSAFLLSRLAKWSMPFTLVTLICGTVPILSFWAEKRASRDVRTRFIDAPEG